jgi:PAS domain S-box-containing protein
MSDERVPALDLRRILDRLPAMVGYWDVDLRNRFANDAYVTFFGTTPEALIGKHISDLLGPELFALNQPYMLAALAGEEQLFERAIPDPHGGVVRYTQASYIPDVQAGRVAGFVALVTDITRRETAERRVLELERSRRTMVESMLRSEELERDHVARFIHDDTIQGLTAVNLQLDRARRSVAGDPEATTRLLDEAERLISAVLAKTRRLTFDMRPQAFSEHRLADVIGEFLGRMCEPGGVAWSLDVNPHRFDPFTEHLIYRTVRDAILDMMETAQASRVDLTIRGADRLVRGSISDDGGGADARRSASGGLHIARERVMLAGGDLTVRSTATSGCTIAFEIPLEGGLAMT